MNAVLQHAHDLLRLYAMASPVDRLLIEASLRPTAGDTERVFDRDLAHDVAMMLGGRPGWAGRWPAGGGNVSIRLAARGVEDLRAGRLGLFPEGYRKIAGRLRPGPTWLTFELVEPGLRFDGLVALGGRFVLFPKPWKTQAGAAARAAEHWAA